MSDEHRPKLAEGGDDFFDIKESFPRQHRVIRFNGMSLAHDEFIPVWIILVLRGDVHLLKIDLCQDLHDAHIAADMSGFAFYDHIDHVFS